MLLRRVALALVGLTVLGCAGHDALDTGLGGGGGGLSFADKVAASKQLTDYIATLNTGSATTFHDAIAAKMRSIPSFKDVSIHDEIVECKFLDGQPYAFLDNLKASGAPPALPIHRRSLAAGEVCKGKSCALLTSLGTLFTNVPGKVRPWMKDAGYTAGPGDFSVNGLIQACAENDVILLCGHGGIVGGTFWLMTSDRVGDPIADAEVKPYLADKSVIWLSGANDRASGPLGYNMETRYCVGVKFAEAHLRFKPGALYVNFGCNGVADTKWLDALSNGGLSAYLGWTTPVHDGVSADMVTALFDHLTGSNLSDDYEAPDQRPFDLVAVCDDLRARGFFDETGFNGKCMLHRFDDRFSLIRPTIKNLTVKGYDRELWLDGDFGTQPGDVTVAGTRLDLLGGWSATHLEATLPDTGAGSAGDVIVTVAGHPSNPVPLTRWVGDFLYTDRHTALQDGVVLKARFHVSLRADAREFREAPHGGLISAPISSTCDRSSTCHWTATGQQGVGPNALVWSGSGDPVLAPPHPFTSDHYFQVAYTIDPKTKKLQLGMVMYAKKKVHLKGGGVDAFTDFGFNTEMFDEKPGPFNLPTVDIDLDTDYSIPGDLRQYSAGAGASDYSLVWLKIAGDPFPNDNTSHRPHK